MKERKILILLLLLISFFPLTGQEQVPLQTEQLIYSIDTYNGSGYSSTFCTEESKNIYILADKENFIWARKSLVYFWPLTQEVRLETNHLFETLDGYLVVTNKEGKVTTLQLTNFTYTQSQDVYGITWQVKLEDEARKAIEEFGRIVLEQEKKISEYQQELARFNQFQNLMVERIKSERALGLDITYLVEELQAMVPPVQPETPRYNVYPLKTGFMLKLPPGEYKIHFVDEMGRIYEGSEKTLVVFKRRRSNAVGYELIPADRWTKPLYTYTPSSIIYVDGSTHLYLKPFYEDEYNDFYYNKMLINQSEGNRQVFKWESLRQVAHSRLETVSENKEAQAVMEKEYYAEQISGVSRGYNIVPFDPDGTHKGRDASLKAFHIPINRSSRYIKVRLQNMDDGEYLNLSEREIRIKPAKDYNPVLVVLMLLPIVTYFLVGYLRRRALRHLQENVSNIPNS